MAKDKLTPEEKQEAYDRRMAGIVPFRTNFELSSAKKLRLAWFWIPWLGKLIILFSTISIVFTVLSLVSFYSRPQAVAYVSFYDGHIECAPSKDAKGNPRKRSNSEAKVCMRLKPYSREEN